jgi:hypothetical protein
MLIYMLILACVVFFAMYIATTTEGRGRDGKS